MPRKRYRLGNSPHRRVIPSRDPRDLTQPARPTALLRVRPPPTNRRAGSIEISIKHPVHLFTVEGADPVDKTRYGFFITASKADTALENDIAKGGCLLDDLDHTLVLFTFEDMQSHLSKDGDEYKFSYTIAEGKAGEYSLYYTKCVPNSAVSFTITVDLYNTLPNGDKDYLSAGEKPLPTMYMFAFFTFAAAAVVWAWVLFNAKQTQPGSVKRIHWLMLLLVCVKSLSVLSKSFMYHVIRVHGDPDGWNVAFYIFSAAKGLMFFTIVVLIGTGWSFLKPFLNEREKQMLMLVIPLQVFANIAADIVDADGPALAGWLEWRDLFHLLDIVCCCAILFPIVWSIKHLREAAMTDGKKVRNMNKLILFRQFYVMVIAYIYFTRIIVFLLKSTAAYNLTWLADFASEAATLAFYLTTGYMFRPVVDNPYLHLNEDELDLEEIEMRVEEGRSL